jgi:hypothetical protein
MHKPDAEGSAKNLNSTTKLREHEKVIPHRAGIATPPGHHHGGRSGSESAANRTRITARIGGQGHPESGTDRQAKTARPRHRSARPEPKPTAKRKTLGRARSNQSTSLSLTRSRIAAPSRPRNANSSYSARRSDQRVEHSRFTTFHSSSVGGPCTPRKQGKDRQRISLLRKAQT